MIKGATFSHCEKYRYSLWRFWDKNPYALFLMLNPSTADEENNDPTVERCQRYAAQWGYGGLVVCNIFAYRATKPKDMKSQDDPVGPDNDDYITKQAADAGIVVCAWGNHGSHENRSKNIVATLRESNIELHCLKITKQGEPGHPLYLRKDIEPQRWNGER